jgi:hypothetical protein
MYFIYNHDQVYMKDLTKECFEGLYYMNGFMAIDSKSQPLTIFAMSFNNKYVLMVPTINTGYSNKNFIMKLHTVKTRY